MIQKISFEMYFNRETIITTLKLNLTQYEHSPINIGEFRSISNSDIIPTFLVHQMAHGWPVHAFVLTSL